MGTFTRGVGVAISAGLLTPAALSATPSGAFGSAAGPDATRAPRTTLVNLDVDGCRDSCRVQLAQAREDGNGVFTTRRKLTDDGSVSFRVPRRRTAGMTIFVLPRWDDSHSVPLAALHYEGEKVGSVVTTREARKADRAQVCWSGTRKRVVNLKVRAERWTRTRDGETQSFARVYTRTTRATDGPWLDTRRGSVAVQDFVVCRS